MLKRIAPVAVLISTVLLAQAPTIPSSPPTPVGNGIADDATAIQAELNAAGISCATVVLACTNSNTYKVSKTLFVPKCVRLAGACGAVPDEASLTTVGTTLKWAGDVGPVVYFHDAPGASLSGVSIECGTANVTAGGTTGIQYDSDDNPSSSFVNVDNLMINNCHLGVVLGLPAMLPKLPLTGCASATALKLGCYQADQFKLERYRINGNRSDPLGEGIHINSANAAQGSLIADGNIQGVRIGIHIITTNGGLVIQSSNYGAPATGDSPTFLQIETNVANSPTLINDEVEGTGVNAIVDHAMNPFNDPGNPVWVGNAWNNHPIWVDGCDNITSIGNFLNNATLILNNFKPDPPSVNGNCSRVVSINEAPWNVQGGVAWSDVWSQTQTTLANLTTISPHDGSPSVFPNSLISNNMVAARSVACLQAKSKGPTNAKPGDLLSCENNTEGQHYGRLYLGDDLMLFNNGDGTLENEGLMSIQVGLNTDGTGLKHQTISTGSIPAAGTVKVSLPWTSAFANASYEAVCSVQDDSGSLQMLNTTAPTPTAVSASVRNNDAALPHVGTLVCFAIHD